MTLSGRSPAVHCASLISGPFTKAWAALQRCDTNVSMSDTFLTHSREFRLLA